MSLHKKTIWTHEDCAWKIVRTKGNRVRYQCDRHGTMDVWEPATYRNNFFQDFGRAIDTVNNQMEKSKVTESIKDLLAKTKAVSTSLAKGDAERIADQAGVEVREDLHGYPYGGDYMADPDTMEDSSLPGYDEMEMVHDNHEPGPSCTFDCGHDEGPESSTSPQPRVKKWVTAHLEGDEPESPTSSMETVELPPIPEFVDAADPERGVLTLLMGQQDELEAELPDRDDHSDTVVTEDFELEVPQTIKNQGESITDDFVWVSLNNGPPELMMLGTFHQRLDPKLPHICADNPHKLLTELMEFGHWHEEVRAWLYLYESANKFGSLGTNIVKHNIMKRYSREVLVEVVKEFVPDAHITTKTTKAQLFDMLNEYGP